MKTHSPNTQQKQNPASQPFFDKNKDTFLAKETEIESPFFTSETIQAKLSIGNPNDEFEAEADQMADQVIRMPERNLNLQMKCSECTEKEKLQKSEMEKEEEFLQTKAKKDNTPVLESKLSSKLAQSKGKGSQLSNPTNQKMSNAFGRDFSDVKVHTDDSAVQMNQSLNAKAFTNGKDIYFNQNQYQPNSTSGQHLLAHELTHVVQQSVSNRIQRAVTATKTNYKSYPQIAKMTLYAFDEYTKLQADWHASGKLTQKNITETRTTLRFARKNKRMATLGKMKVGQINSQIRGQSLPVVRKYLDIYSAAVKEAKPFQYTALSDVRKAIDVGKQFEKLMKVFPSYVLNTALQEDPFNFMYVKKLIDDVIKYYTTAKQKPVFQAFDGSDFYSYYNMMKVDKINPLTFDSAPLQGQIRNFHRFEKKALEALQNNFNDTSKKKPLTLILHTALDKNGAFHRDPKLTAVIKSKKMNTIMIEGKEKLEEYKNAIGPIAQKYGVGDKIDQLMFAGHGNSRSMQLAGKVAENTEEGEKKGKLKEVNERLTLHPTKKDKKRIDTDAIMKEVLSHMEGKKWKKKSFRSHRRIIFNACLTNSNSVREAIKSTDIVKAQKEIKNYIKNNSSLATYMQELATTSGKDVKSIGSNASFAQIDLIDSKGNLDLISSSDKKITASKLTYVAHGTEPAGALRAVLESWADNRSATKKAMKKRIKRAGNSWDEVIIKTLYKRIIKKHWDNPERIRVLGYFALRISEMENRAECKVSLLKIFLSNIKVSIPKDIIYTLKALEKTSEWKSKNFIPLVMYQIWFGADATDASAKKKLLKTLSKKFDCKTAKEFLDLDFLDTEFVFDNELLDTKGHGQMIIALLLLLSNNNSLITSKLYAESYLLSEVNANDRFDSSKKVKQKLAGLATEEDILQKIGKYTPPTTSGKSPKNPPKKKQNANIKITGDKQNKEFVQSLTLEGTVNVSPVADVYLKPDTSSKKLVALAYKSTIYILGTIGSWWAIEYDHLSIKGKKHIKTKGTAFIPKSDVKVKK